MRSTPRSRFGWSMLAAGALLGVLTGCGADAQSTTAPSAQGVSAEDERPPAPAATVGSELTGLASADGTPDVPRSPATVAPAESPDAPVRMTASSVRVDAEVVPVGVADDGQMELPADPDVLGWYHFGPSAGDGSGSVVLAGHVDSLTYGVGQLARLPDSRVGDEVLVRTESGLDLRYTVVDVQNIPKLDLPLEDVFRRDGDERLLLITCGGEFDRQHGGYTDNIVVTAAPAGTR